jgi:hypothetical protein
MATTDASKIGSSAPSQFELINGAVGASTPQKQRLVRDVQVFTTPAKQSIGQNHIVSGGETKTPAAAEKTNIWARIFFGVAIVAMVVASHCVCRSWKERSPSLLIPALFWVLVATIIGTVSEILYKKPKVETIAGDMRAPLPVAPSAAFLAGQPVPIVNVGNTCFINASTQCLMNDDRLTHIFREICERAKDRHLAFYEFLSLFPSQISFSEWFSCLWESKKKDAPLLKVRSVGDVLAMLAQRKSKLGYGTEAFKKQYPCITAFIGQFSSAQREADFPVVADAGEELYQEFARMKDDQKIMTFFSNERSEVERRIKGFEAYLNLITSYERAVQHEPHTVCLGGGFFSSHSSIGNIRHLIQKAGDGSQEDAAELLDCLVQYIRPCDYPEAFFSMIRQRTWAECSVDKKAEEETKVAAKMKLHNQSKKPEDQLTTLPDDNITKSPAEPYVILRSDNLTEGQDGQQLLDQTLGSTRKAQTDPTAIFMKNGEAKLYYATSEQLIIEPPPDRFILQLMRFQLDGKVSCNVNMPLEIRMSSQVYELKSIVVHEGTSAEGGHYTAMLKKTIEGETKWWYASDSHVTSEDTERYKQTALKQGYLYFYVKKDAAII